MTPAILAADDDLVDALRGTSALRPAADRGLAGGLRAWLDDGVFERVGVPAVGAVRLTTRDAAGAGHSGGPTAMLRGALVAQLLGLRVAGMATPTPFLSASRALAASGRDEDLVGVLASLDADDRSRLAAEVDAHGHVLATRLPTLPSRWSPRCGVRQRVGIAGGGVVLRGLVDLALGAPGGARACVCLVDVTTSTLEDRHVRGLAYLALLETMRCGEPPLRVAALSTADGTAIVRDVDPELLAGAVGAVLDAVGATVAAP